MKGIRAEIDGAKNEIIALQVKPDLHCPLAVNITSGTGVSLGVTTLKIRPILFVVVTPKETRPQCTDDNVENCAFANEFFFFGGGGGAVL